MVLKGLRKLCILVMIGICLVVFSLSPSFAQTSETAQPKEPSSPFYKAKDPFIAGLLSWFMLGVGQIYVQEYTKGSLFIAANLADKAALILLISHINNKYSPSSGDTIYINWKEFNTGTKFLILSYFGASFGLRFYSAFDAYRSAQKYNERYNRQKDQEGLSIDFGRNSISLGYTFQFTE